MDYEKAYKEAHSRAEMFRDTIYGGIAEEIFPDLRESSYDEKIRKALIKYYSFNKDGGSHALDNITPEQILDWLEMQKPTDGTFVSEELLRVEAPQKVRIYISGPISGYDLEERRKAFMEIEERLKAQGYETVNPMKNGLPDEATTHEHMKRDIELLLTCDRIYFMKKWTHSKGCKLEFDVATAIGLPVMFEEAIELTEFCKMITFE